MQCHGMEYKDVTADAGYESEENYCWFESAQKPCYIKPQNYERSKTKKYKSNMALLREHGLKCRKTNIPVRQARSFGVKYVGKRKEQSGFESRDHIL